MEALATFSYDINRFPRDEQVGKIHINVAFVPPPNMQLMIPRNTFSISASVIEFIQNEESHKTQEIYHFLREANVDEDDINSLVMKLIQLAKLVINCPDEYCLDFALLIWVTIDVDNQQTIDELRRQELTQISFDEVHINSRPASKLVVASLRQEKYDRHENNNWCSNDGCTICFEDFSDQLVVVVLPCGHKFDHECIVKWFQTHHACPLCRFELACEE